MDAKDFFINIFSILYKITKLKTVYGYKMISIST